MINRLDIARRLEIGSNIADCLTKALLCILLLCGSLSTSQAAWQFSDIGSTGSNGSFSSNLTTSEYSLNGGGAGAGGSSDALAYFYDSGIDDFEVTVRVNSINPNNFTAQAGIMVRTSTSANAPNVFVYVSAGDGVGFSFRDQIGQSTSTTWGASQAPPAWLRLLRLGTRFWAYSSFDGASWTLAGTRDVPQLSGAVLVGLAATSGISGNLSNASFSKFTHVINLPYSIPGLVTWLRGDAGIIKNSSSLVSMWMDQSGKGNHALQSTALNQPIWVDGQLNGKPAIHFTNGSGTHLAIPSNDGLNSPTYSVYSVARHALTSQAIVTQKLNSSSANQYALWFNGGAAPSLTSSAYILSSSSTLGSFGILSGAYDQT